MSLNHFLQALFKNREVETLIPPDLVELSNRNIDVALNFETVVAAMGNVDRAKEVLFRLQAEGQPNLRVLLNCKNTESSKIKRKAEQYRAMFEVLREGAWTLQSLLYIVAPFLVERELEVMVVLAYCIKPQENATKGEWVMDQDTMAQLGKKDIPFMIRLLKTIPSQQTEKSANLTRIILHKRAAQGRWKKLKEYVNTAQFKRDRSF